VTPTHRTTRRLDAFPSGLVIPAGEPVAVKACHDPGDVVIRFGDGHIAIIPADAIEPIPPREEQPA
jgi:hypothetical protein